MTLIVQNAGADAEIARRVALPWPIPGTETGPWDTVVPVLTTVAPATGVHGGAVVPVTATGTLFVKGARVAHDGAIVSPSAWVSATSVTGSLPAASVPAAGSKSVVVVNPSGITSEPRTFVWT